MQDQPLVVATVGLVIATSMLVVATAIPAVQRFRENRALAAAKAARVVPVINILGPRLEGTVKLLLSLREPSLEQLDRLIAESEVDLRRSAELRSLAYDISLKFANEVYLVHHFLTTGIDDLRFLGREAERNEGTRSLHDLSKHTSPHHTPGNFSTEGRLALVCAHYKAAEISLMAAEDLIPQASRTVDGDSFWGRYASVLRRRETEAEKLLVELRARSRQRQ